MPPPILVRVERRDGPDAPKHWDEFAVPYTKNANVISVLMDIQRNPVTTAGERVPPPVWDQACLDAAGVISRICDDTDVQERTRTGHACPGNHPGPAPPLRSSR